MLLPRVLVDQRLIAIFPMLITKSFVSLLAARRQVPHQRIITMVAITQLPLCQDLNTRHLLVARVTKSFWIYTMV